MVSRGWFLIWIVLVVRVIVLGFVGVCFYGFGIYLPVGGLVELAVNFTIHFLTVLISLRTYIVYGSKLFIT